MKSYVPLSEGARDIVSDFYFAMCQLNPEEIAEYFMFGRSNSIAPLPSLKQDDRRALIHNFLLECDTNFSKEFRSNLDYLLDKHMSDDSEEGVSM